MPTTTVLPTATDCAASYADACTTVLTHGVGSYSVYMGTVYLVVCSSYDNPDARIILKPLQPPHSVPYTRLRVSVHSLTTTNLLPAVIVEYEGTKYIVTGKGMIVSCATNKPMRWKDGSPQRASILNAATEANLILKHT